jgi:hypothetical protein
VVLEGGMAGCESLTKRLRDLVERSCGLWCLCECSSLVQREQLRVACGQGLMASGMQVLMGSALTIRILDPRSARRWCVCLHGRRRRIYLHTGVLRVRPQLRRPQRSAHIHYGAPPAGVKSAHLGGPRRDDNCVVRQRAV